jgi:hypothetical protein
MSPISRLPPQTFLGLFAFAGVLLVQQVSSFAFLPNTPSPTQTQSHSSRSSMSLNLFSLDRNDNNDPSDHYDDHRKAEFMNLEPVQETDIRRQRRLQDAANRQQFVPFGDQLWDLRAKLDTLSHRLVDAIQDNHHDNHDDNNNKEHEIRQKLRRVEQQDPELVYMLELMELDQAAQEGRTEDAAQHRAKALAARSCLPHFQLEGLWVGKYGTNGYEMVNITYTGDTLFAYKVTGDQNVPRGKVTFSANLHPLRYNTGPQSQKQSHSQETALQPIELTENAARKWGTRQLPRYAGLGRVAEEGFVNDEWMDGQLIVIGDDYFSFAWIPIEQQIFFGRPSPELALKMLRESGSAEFGPKSNYYFDNDNANANNAPPPPSIKDNVEIQKDFVARCLQVTDEFVQDELITGDAFGCIWSSGVDMEEEQCYFE